MSLLRQFLALSTWVRVLIAFVFVWGALVFLFASKLNMPQSTDGGNAMKRLNQALAYLEHNKESNAEMRRLIEELLGDKSLRQEHREKLMADIQAQLIHGPGSRFTKDSGGAGGGAAGGGNDEPSMEYENLRRRVYSNTQEMWRYVQSEVQQMKTLVGQTIGVGGSAAVAKLNKQMDEMLELGAEHKSSLLNDMMQMREVDGYESWRHREAAALSDLVQRRLTALQNPDNCGTAQKLVCRLNKGCGYGCQLHHVVYCFIMAYATERTLILKSKGWRYHKGGWDEVFQPLSQTCSTADGTSHASWSSQHHNTQVIDLPIIDGLNPRTAFLPLAIPEDLAPRLQRLHGDPIVWWVGQFLKYLLRTQPATQEMLDLGRSKLGFQHPIVGVHIRRTDKVGTEASLHTVDEYMRGVEEYYAQLEQVQRVDKRRVYLASDDAKVIEEARSKYPSYEIIGDPDVARMAAVSTRYTDSSRNGIILDIHLLSLCDHLVCTFSSQVCRVAYEIMQAAYPDASNRFRSLDDIYYYGGQNAHNREAVLPHRPRNHDEIQMKVGDLVGVAGNHWNGFSKGKNTRTNQGGLFPSFKVVDKVETADFPRYAHVK